MKNYVTFFALALILSITINAQKTEDTKIIEAFKNYNYDWIIEKYSKNSTQHDAETLYFLGMSYYMQEKDSLAFISLKAAVKKDSTYAPAHYMNGVFYSYKKDTLNAFKSTNTAIRLAPENAEYLSGLGDVYFSNNDNVNALKIYHKVIKMPTPPSRTYRMISLAYGNMGDKAKALEAAYIAKEKLDKNTYDYFSILYNIGIYEYLNKNYAKAEENLKELILLAPDDFHAIAKLIQVYHGQEKYEEAQVLIDELYEAYGLGLLKNSLKESFCFDQFYWKNKLIYAYEVFAEKEGKLYYKHIYYVTNKEGKSEFTIQTENSVFSEMQGTPKYAIGMTRDEAHFTFSFYLKKELTYAKIKALVLDVLNNKNEPLSSSSRAKKE